MFIYFVTTMIAVLYEIGVFKSNPIQLKPLNQSNPNRKPIKTAKVWIGLDLIFHKLLGSDFGFIF